MDRMPQGRVVETERSGLSSAQIRQQLEADCAIPDWDAGLMRGYVACGAGMMMVLGVLAWATR